ASVPDRCRKRLDEDSVSEACRNGEGRMRGNGAEGGARRGQFAGYRALACDGDGTLTSRGRMAATTRRALESLRASGRQLILVTGETLKELADFPHLDLFDRIVAENGA